jgi:hypothetical protein
VSVDADFLGVEEALRESRFDDALKHYAATLLPCSDAPGIAERRQFLEAGVAKAVWRCTDAESLWRYTGRIDDDGARERLLALLPADDPRRSVLGRQLSGG